jgi:hypothetical protein
VHGRDQRPDGELPLEAEPQVHEDHHEPEHEREDRLLHKLLRHARADHLDATDGVVLAERRAHPVDDAAGPALPLVGGAHLDQKFARGAELLDLHLAEVQAADGLANAADIGRPGGGLHLDEGAAFEVDTDVQPEGEERHDADDGQKSGERKAPMPVSHEGDVEGFRDVIDERHGCLPLSDRNDSRAARAHPV